MGIIAGDNEFLTLNEKSLTGRNRRLLHEWRLVRTYILNHENISLKVIKTNSLGLPTGYLITYHIHSICGVKEIENLGEWTIRNRPIFAEKFKLMIEIPESYPCIDAPLKFTFLTHNDQGEKIPHPWHPNIKFFGEMAGRVCLNMMNTHADIAWCIDRIAAYLRYDTYHAIQENPYPEDLKVARWVVTQGEPNEWIYFDQETTQLR